MQGVQWPGLLNYPGSQLLATLYQLEQSQWWAPEKILEHQLRQLRDLLMHAAATVPYYRETFAAAAVDPLRINSGAEFMRLPILTRAAIQDAGMALRSKAVPREHGALSPVQTSGSTGRPIRTVSTEVTQFFWQVFTLRSHLWQQDDMSSKLVAIRTEGNKLGEDGVVYQGWGAAAEMCFMTGESALLGLMMPIDVQARWLVKHNPVYLLSHPSNLLALARYFQEHDLQLPHLRKVLSFGETVPDELRQACRAVWGVGVVDGYSSQEVGYMALQCPRHEHFHIQSEGVYLEVLDEEGIPCAPGEIGRVVVTPLHNFAAPLIRYELGDYAEVGAPCDCGRGLPVLTRILGRQRNMLTLPDGRQLWPSFPSKTWSEIAPIRQLQLVQQDLHTLEARVVMGAPLTAEQEARLRDYFQTRFGYPFTIIITCLDAFARAPNSKFEDFISRIVAPAQR